jgi:hemolysin III
METPAKAETVQEHVAEALAEVKPRLRGWLHAATAPVAAVGGILLVLLSPPGPARIGSAVFAACAMILFTVSATKHRGSWSPRVNTVLTRIDHASIFLLIAGSYTPFTLVTLNGPWGWALFAWTWGLALAGVVFKVFATGKFEKLSLAIYLGMGWCIVLAIEPLVSTLETGGLVLLLLGGLSYTGGVAFYVWERLRYHHAIWHAFVLGGSVLQYFAVLFYVIPGAA